MDDRDDDFAAGRHVGQQPDGSAIDCPYLPGAEPARRKRWLEGFASVRPDTNTRKSDPPPPSEQPDHAA